MIRMAETSGHQHQGVSLESSEEGADDLAGQDSKEEEAPILQECINISSDTQNESTDSPDLNISGEGKRCTNLSAAPVLSVIDVDVSPNNALRSPPKLQPAVAVVKRYMKFYKCYKCS